MLPYLGTLGAAGRGSQKTGLCVGSPRHRPIGANSSMPAIRIPKIGEPRGARQGVVIRPTQRASSLLREQVRQLLKELEQEPDDGEIPPPDAA